MSERVVRWSQKLLDLSLRNRLLNVRDGKQVVPLFCRDVATLEDRLASSESVPIETGDPEDGFLVSNVTPEETKKRLTHLFRVAKTDLEESGVNTLFVALGFLSWRPVETDEKFYRAPLILVPVKLVRKSLSDIRLAILDEDSVVNPTLLELLRSEYRITVPQMDPPPMDEKGLDVNAIVNAFAQATAVKPGWTVTRDAALGQFSFGKFVMWKDLTAREEDLRQNPLVNHLIAAGGVYDDGVKVFAPEKIGEKIVPGKVFCPLSADSSQMTAVLYSALGKTFVLHGPPGTGKSQTITNLIAHNLALGRRVLFVSEKKAALDVVHRRLASIGLKPFCLELHSNKSGKTDVLAQFAEALAVPDCSGPADWTTTAQNLAAARDELNAYVKALHKVYPNGFTACDCFAQVIETTPAEGGAAPTKDRGLLTIETLTQPRADYEACLRLADELANGWRATNATSVAALAPLVGDEWTPGFEQQVAATADDLEKASVKGFFSRLGAAFRNRARVPFGSAFKMTPQAAKAFADATRDLRGVLAWRRVKAAAETAGLAGLVAAIETGAVAPADAATRLREAYAVKMLNDAITAEPALAGFNGLNHDACVKRFRELDARLAELAKGEVFAKLAARLPRRRAGDCPAASELGILRRECEKKTRQKPVRQLLAEIPHLAADLKPCFLMSPLSVAQYLPADAAFDLVVFDEASQIPVWDAIGAIARGKQLVCVGDPKQMPPTNFFQKGETEADDEDDETVADMESILDECLAAGVHSAYLNWHYRSRHESLIAFSNHNYYGDRLNTFPCASDSPRLGVRFEFVEGGTFERRASRTNRKEAEALVDYVFTRFAEPGYRRRSVGVVTFSQAQKDLIEDLIEARREKEPACEAFFGDDTDEPFFVKNLENVQGDERDVILFSVGYAPDAEGKFAMNFGPLNRDGGERRLNVAVTRAKQQVVVFSSIHGSQIDPSRTAATGALHLKNFLEFAEKGLAPAAGAAAATDDPLAGEFPATVAQMLREHGWQVDEQVGTGCFRIDLAVRRRQGAGYLLALECDGPGYAQQRTARDRDVLRASVLKGLGWHVTRLWSVDWTFDRTRAEGALLSLLDALETREAQQAAEKAKAAPPPAPRPAADALPPGVTALRAKPVKEVEKTRSIDEIPAAELVAAMGEVKKDFGACEEDALYRETLKRFGLTVLNAKARAALDAAKRTIAVLLVGAMAASLSAADPYVGYIYPAGLQAGTTNRVIVGGQGLNAIRGVELSGTGVKVVKFEVVPGFPNPTGDQRKYLLEWLAKIAAGDPAQPPLPVENEHFNEWRSNSWWTVLGTLDAQKISLVERNLHVPRNPLQMSPALSQRVLVTLAADADAAEGPRELRIWTNAGFSPPRPILVTRAPRVEEPLYTPPVRTQPARPEIASVPCVLDGQIYPGETDLWRFPGLKKGETLRFVLTGREFQPYIGDAVPGFFNPALRVLDANGHEVAFADDFFYHPDPRLSFTVPADGDYTLEVHDVLYRGRDDFVYSITAYREAKLPAPLTATGRPLSELGALSLSPLPKYDLPAAAQGVRNLRGCGARSEQTFEIAAEGDYVFDLLARREGSALDARLTILDAAGKTRARFDDATNRVHVGSVIQAESDPVGTVHLAPGTYTARIEDEAGKGALSSDYWYTLRVSRPAPRYEVWTKRSGLVLRPWWSQPLPLEILRHDGFDGPITFEDNELLTFKPKVIPATTNSIVVQATMKKHPPCFVPDLKIWTTAVVNGETQRVAVVAANEYNQAFAWDHLVPARGFAFRGLEAPPPKKPAQPAAKPKANPDPRKSKK